MSWTVILTNEQREPVEMLGTEFHSEFIENEELRSRMRLLQYLDPYGDTVFNHLQMTDLINDLHALKDMDKGHELIDPIIELAEKCRYGTLLYLVFYGD